VPDFVSLLQVSWCRTTCSAE